MIEDDIYATLFGNAPDLVGKGLLTLVDDVMRALFCYASELAG